MLLYPSPRYDVWLPHLVKFPVILQIMIRKIIQKVIAVNIHIIAQSFKIRIKITQLHVDEAHQYHRIFGKLIHHLKYEGPAPLHVGQQSRPEFSHYNRRAAQTP